MKKQHYLLLIGWSMAISSFSQDFKAFNPNAEAWYINIYDEIWPVIATPNGTGPNISYYKTYNTVYDTANLFAGWGEECFDYEAGLLGGKNIDLMSDGSSNFYNYRGDTIKFPANLFPGLQWNLIKPLPHVVIKANVTAKNYQNILSASDSVFVISLQMETSSGQIISHPINGKEIWLSKNYGLIKSFNFYVFPKDTNSWELFGYKNQNTTMGKQNLTRKKIYDYAPGDVFHTITKDIQVITMPDTTYYGNGTIIHRLREVNSRIDYNDSVVYQYSDCERVITYSSGVPDTSFFQGTSTEGISLLYQSQSFADALPREAISYNYGGIGGFHEIGLYQLSSLRLQKIATKDMFSFNLSPDCLSYSIFDPCCTQEKFIEGCGGPYYSIDEWLTGVKEHKLLYYKKGTEIWGTPIAPSCESLINGISVNPAQSSNFILFPNPASECTQLSTKTNKKFTLFIYRSDGKLLKTVNTIAENHKLYRKEFGSGIFFLKILCEDGSYEIKKLIFN